MTSHPTSLLAALNCTGAVHLVVGSNPLAATRCSQSVAAGAKPVLIAPGTADLHYGLRNRIDAGEVKWLAEEFQDAHLSTLGRAEVDNVVDAVFVTSGPREALAIQISALCRRLRIPVNVVDAPQLCTFTLLSTHTDGPLQIGVTTNGRGCKLASRIRREVAATLPSGLGAACARLGDVRRRIQTEDALAPSTPEEADEETGGQTATFNRLVIMPGARNAAPLDAEEAAVVKERRARWLAQVCEYWPLNRLAALTDEDVDSVLQSYHQLSGKGEAATQGEQTGAATRIRRVEQRGRLILAGSGPGHPDMLTRAAYRAIQVADLILADKLVPAGVLDLIPRRTEVQIARKFPGNADAAQEELLERALRGVRDENRVVLRLKQGDPFVYGRGGEEVAFFAQHGLADRVMVVPGITSALSAPLFAGIPPTQRDVADQVLVCTGTGKKGKPPKPPGYVPSRTVVFLMALHRIEGLVAELTTYGVESEESPATKPSRRLWPVDTPCAVIERASCPDQRVIRTTLGSVAQAIQAEGSRPPGLLVVGRACEALYTMEKGRAWAVEEGFRGLSLGEELDLPQ